MVSKKKRKIKTATVSPNSSLPSSPPPNKNNEKKTKPEEEYIEMPGFSMHFTG